MSINTNSDELIITRSELAQITAQRLANTSYGSITPSQSSTNASYAANKMSAARRTFCLFVTFDLILTFIVWVIYSQSTGIKPFSTAIINEVERYTFSTSMFDLVLCSAARFVPLLLAYALFRLNNPWVVAMTTFITCAFLVAKAFNFDFDVAHRNAISYAALLISFTIAWIETWMLDFKVIPSEQRMYARLHPFENSRTTNPVSDHFYSPENSDGSDNEISSIHRSISQKYQKMANDSWQKAKAIYDIPHNGWRRCNNLVASKVIKPYGKVYRLQTVIDCPLNLLFNILCENVEDTPMWNRTVLDCKRLKVIDENTSIIYVLAAEAVGGMVSSRDFVNLTHWKLVGNTLMSSCISVDYPDSPISCKYIRAQNRPAMMVLSPIDDNKCHFTWILNIDLKGWLPKKLVEQALANTQIDFVDALNCKVRNCML